MEAKRASDRQALHNEDQKLIPGCKSLAKYYARSVLAFEFRLNLVPFDQELHMPFNFALMNLDWHPANVRNVVETVEQTIAGIPNAYPNYVLGNHDDRRLASRLGLAKARAAMLLLLTLRRTPTLYYGDELGMTHGAIAPELLTESSCEPMKEC